MRVEWFPEQENAGSTSLKRNWVACAVAYIFRRSIHRLGLLHHQRNSCRRPCEVIWSLRSVARYGRVWKDSKCRSRHGNHRLSKGWRRHRCQPRRRCHGRRSVLAHALRSTRGGTVPTKTKAAERLGQIFRNSSFATFLTGPVRNWSKWPLFWNLKGKESSRQGSGLIRSGCSWWTPTQAPASSRTCVEHQRWMHPAVWDPLGRP